MQGRSLLFGGVSLVAALLVACGDDSGPSGGGDAGGTGITLEISPASAELDVVNGIAANQPFTATAHFADGSIQDVTAQTTWTCSPTFAYFTGGGATLTAAGPVAGHATVLARYQGASAMAPVTVKVSSIRVDPGAPANAPDLFAAATDDPARAPTVVYPSDKTLVPPNLGTFDVHWTDAVGNDLFEVELISDVVDVKVFTPTTNPASFVTFTADEWKIVGSSLYGGAFKVAVRGLAQASPQTAGTSSPIAIGVSADELKGGIYYWASSKSGIFRHDFDKPTDPAEEFYTPAESGNHCVACHALSRDGTKMVVTLDGGDGLAQVLDVASRAPLFDSAAINLRSNFSSFNPDGTQFLATSGGVITIRDTATGTLLQTVPTGAPGTHADWSPTGDKIAWAEKGSGADWSYNGGGRIWTATVDPATLAIGTPVMLVDVPGAGQKAYYPTYSPDGAWILYDVSSEDAYNDASAEIWVVKSDGTQPPIKLVDANVGGGLTNSWPRWAPFQQQLGGEMNEPLYWFTVSSMRAFGVRKPGGQTPQVWMAPFFPNRAAAGQDPTLPAFWLPFQDLGTNNHIAQWTETVVPIN
jgi:hypothetical protein